MAAPTYEASIVAVTPQPTGSPTFVEIAAVIPTGLTIVDDLGAPGGCSISAKVTSLEAAAKARLATYTTPTPLPCELWVRRGTTALVFAGPITGYTIQNKTITLTAPGLLAYLLYWLADVNVLSTLNAGTPATEFAFTGIDQALIVQRLCDAWQAQLYGHDGIVTTGLAATGITRDLTISSRDGKLIMPLIQEMGVRSNGFDLSVDPNTRALTMWSPRKGTDRSTGPAAVILDQRSIGEPNLSCTVAPGSIGSEVFASSSSTQGVSLTSIKSNLALRASFGRSYVTRAFQDISVQATLDDHAQRAADDNATAAVTLAPTLLPVPGFAYGDFATGDTIAYDYDAGLGRQTMTPRVQSIAMSPDSGRELLTVGLV